jgi:TonB-linked SusC/RagA family outer membrane protein
MKCLRISNSKIKAIDKNKIKLLIILTTLFFLGTISIVRAEMQIKHATVTLVKENITIKDIIKNIKTQTGFDIIWQSSVLDINKRIDVNFDHTPLKLVLTHFIAEKGIKYAVADQTIIVQANRNETKINPQDSTIYTGIVKDENGKIMIGATIKQPGSKTTFTNSQGKFSIYASKKGLLQISYIGYQTKEVTLIGLAPSNVLNLTLIPGNNNLGVVNIVSNGYQDIPRERSTGSFESISKEQLQHSSDPDLIKRLEGITTSMNFNNQLIPTNSANSLSKSIVGQQVNSSLSKLTIRGKNTLQGTTDPNNVSGQVLVVIDGIASPYSIDKINPNDVESITVLKDAAAASIWGSRAANGVIVVQTKRGKYEKKLNISFNTNFNVTKKIDLFYKKIMSTSEYIDAQIFLHNSANSPIEEVTVNQQPIYLSPVAELLEKQKTGQLSSQEVNSQIDGLRKNDIRNDFSKYLLRDAFTQSYSLAVDGGSQRVAYRLSAGYDRTLNNTVDSENSRLVLNYNTSIKLTKKLEFSGNVTFSKTNASNQAQNNYIGADIVYPFYPYVKLADEKGLPLAVSVKYRPSFLNLLQSTYGNNILNLDYVPLNNMKEGYARYTLQNINFNLGLNYKFSNIITADVSYNYNRGSNEEGVLNRRNSFYTRDIVNFYTAPPGTVDPITGFDISFKKQIPNGSIFRPGYNNTSNETLRGKINVNKQWSQNHQLTGILGVDVSQTYTMSRSNIYYGYDENTLLSNNQLDYVNNLPLLFSNVFGQSQLMIPYTSSNFNDYKVRTYSIYSNLAYTFKNRYTATVSVRKDASSEFGMGTNKSGTPFYSAGVSWNITNEDFYQLEWLPRLQLRSTFGYNGNVNPYIISRPLISYSSGTGINGLFNASTLSRNVTNNKLRPEKTGIFNIGIDFGFKNNRISGSLEYYDKHTKDLITDNNIDPSTGFNNLAFNTASLHGWGTDLTLNSLNLKANLFTWTSNFLLSYNRVKVTDLYVAGAQSAGQVVIGSPSYNEGYDLSRLFAFKWAGLDPTTGGPRGYVNGLPFTVTNNISSIYNESKDKARYFGSAVPVYYGSFRNTFAYGSLSLSINLLYKFGYYFRRPFSDMVSYSSLYEGGIQGKEYSSRWQVQGDESRTNVPSRVYSDNSSRDIFYQYSEINVNKGDHIRLQEINIGYSFNKNWFLKNPRIYTNISNLGIVWRANKLGLDPDINDYPTPRTFAFGFSANF